MATTRAIGTNQDPWNFIADDAGIGSVTSKDGYAHVIGTLGSATGKHVLDLDAVACGLALKFFGTNAAEETAEVRIWGLSQINDDPDPEFLGIYLGELRIELGTTFADSGVFSGDDHFFCWLIKIMEDAGPAPPEPAVIGGERTEPSTGGVYANLSATLLFPSLGFRYVIVELKPTASGGMATVGLLWRLV